jgi:hypothetical protein
MRERVASGALKREVGVFGATLMGIGSIVEREIWIAGLGLIAAGLLWHAPARQHAS